MKIESNFTSRALRVKISTILWAFGNMIIKSEDMPKKP